jgi:NADH:ubiquinone oxidoreductase subunit 5 (subunit L)/multisubunit Na+/H+ antiporter MnhA subunit
VVSFSKVFYFYRILLGFLVWCGYVCVGVVKGGSVFVMELDILRRGTLHLYIPFVIDRYRVIFSFVVLIISSSVLYYNGFYIDGEVFFNRFSKLVLLFVLSILFLVFIPNLLGLIVG